MICLKLVEEEISAALGDAINSAPRAPALAGLARLKYPGRELCVRRLYGGTISARLAKWGWEYKHRGPRPKSTPPINTAAVRAALSSVMPPGVTIRSVEDCGKYLRLILEES